MMLECQEFLRLGSGRNTVEGSHSSISFRRIRILYIAAVTGSGSSGVLPVSSVALHFMIPVGWAIPVGVQF